MQKNAALADAVLGRRVLPEPAAVVPEVLRAGRLDAGEDPHGHSSLAGTPYTFPMAVVVRRGPRPRGGRSRRSSNRSGPTRRAPRGAAPAPRPASARVRRRGAPVAERARRGRGRTRVSAPGGRLRRVVPRFRAGHRDGRAYSAVAIRERLKILLQMAAVLTYGAALPVLKVGRIAGQFVEAALERRSSGRPTARSRRSAATWSTTTSDRRGTRPRSRADAAGLLPGRRDAQSAARVHEGRLRGPHQVHVWNQEFVATSPQGRGTRRSRPRSSARSRSWPRAGSTSRATPQLHQVDVWTSHEGLLLDYEEGLTRRDSLTGDWYDCSAHMLWIGERTRRRSTAPTSSSSRASTTRSAARSARPRPPTSWSSSASG